MKLRQLLPMFSAAGLFACATSSEQGTLAELANVAPDVDEVYLDDSLDRAAESYRNYLRETSESELTPEAMRRLADLQIEKEYGVIGSGQLIEMAVPDAAEIPAANDRMADTRGPDQPSESENDFEQRATAREELLTANPDFLTELPDGQEGPQSAGPREAIKTYQKILDTYPNYERNDQVIYQMSRAYDELGESDAAMELMNRLVTQYPHSKYIDEVYFRQGEFHFVRRQFHDAETAYASIISMGESSTYYELALYKLGWTLYKQEFYDEALDNFIAMLDYRVSVGYDFDRSADEGDEHRVSDTFRVVSLSFSNLGGADVVDDYFAKHGQRSYADRIYSNLGEFYFATLRYADAASTYRSFIKLNPYHSKSPYFSMRVIDIFEAGEFPQLVVQAKKEYATSYALDAPYWNYFAPDESPEVLGFLKTNLNDLANYYHALYQAEDLLDERPKNFLEASRWYHQFLDSFQQDPVAPSINYQLADLLLENEDFGLAAKEYERTAYEYDSHEKSSAAGYAAIYAYREDLKVATGARQREVKQATVDSSLRFADTYQQHEQAPIVLGAAVDDLYEMKDFQLAIASAHTLIDRYPSSDPQLRRSAWAVVANSSIDIAEFQNAEAAYLQVLGLTPPNDESLPAIIDGLAASIYKQGEQALLLEDYRGAANHFLRIKEVAPTSGIRTSAEYDAAAALMHVQDWTMAAGVLESFRSENPEHALNSEATKQLAFIYREDGQVERSAAEHERISAESTDPELSREAMLTAGELYDEANSVDNAIRVFERYVSDYPRPLDIALETRSRLSEIFKSRTDYVRYYQELGEIVAIDASSGSERTDRSRYLAATAALVLAELNYQRFAELQLRQPFEESLAEKQLRMDVALESVEKLVDYEVAEVTAAATFYIAEIYFEFSAALLNSERPAGLSKEEKDDYEMVIEEEAFPFEERALDVHQRNFEMLAVGIYNPWVKKSLDKLAVLMPGRYAKSEISGGFLGSIDTYAYRMPSAPKVGVDGQDDDDVPKSSDASTSVEATARNDGSSGNTP